MSYSCFFNGGYTLRLQMTFLNNDDFIERMVQNEKRLRNFQIY